MPGQRVYLDTSAIVKRYAKEADSDKVDQIYTSAEMKENEIYFSHWNIGEAIGVFDKERYRKQKDPKVRAGLFLDETVRLVGNGSLTTTDITETLLDGISLLFKYHIYIADALQIASAVRYRATEFVTADGRLAKVAQREGLKVISLTPE